MIASATVLLDCVHAAYHAYPLALVAVFVAVYALGAVLTLTIRRND